MRKAEAKRIKLEQQRLALAAAGAALAAASSGFIFPSYRPKKSYAEVRECVARHVDFEQR